MISFTELNLNPVVNKGLHACNYTTPTPIQARSIPSIVEGKDIVASAPTGTGKTAAFVLPALDRLSKIKGGSKPRVLILTPTRELATQIIGAIAKYGKFMQLNTVTLVGGMPYRQQLKGLSRPVDIIVATPGRLLDHMGSRRLDLSAIEMLILDEADRMLDMGFIDDVKKIAKATPANRQTLLFSATVDNKLGTVIKQLLKDPLRIDLSEKKLAPIKIKQELYMADNVQHKARLLQHFIKDGNVFKAIIFCATKISVDKLAHQLDREGHSVAPLHGDLKQNKRNRTIEDMRRGKTQFLIATDVAARGIDIDDITHVINFDLPKFSEDYVHRIGRTGRAGKSGTAISFVLSDDGRHVQNIERFIGEKITLNTVAGLEPSKAFNFNATTKKKRGQRYGGDKPSFTAQGKGAPRDRSAKSDYRPKREGERNSNFKENNNSKNAGGYRSAKRSSFKERDSEGYRPAKRSSFKERDSEGYRPAKRSSFKERDSEGYRPAKRDSFKERDSEGYRPAKRDSFKERDSEGYRPAKRSSFKERDADGRPSAKRSSFKERDSEGYRPAKKSSFKERDSGGRRSSKSDHFKTGKPNKKKSWD